VSRRRETIVVDREGNVEALDKATRLKLRPFAGRYRIVTDSQGLIVLRRELPEETDSVPFDDDDDDILISFEDGDFDEGPRVILAGELLSKMTLFQIVEVIAERTFRGELAVLAADGHTMQLSFDQGALKHARSDRPEHRLGEVMVRENLLSRDELSDLLGRVTADRRLGQVCLERGILGQDALYDALRKQTEGIFFRALLVSDGSYIFTTPDTDRDPPALTVHLPVRPLLMQAIQRLDEMELYRQVIPNDDVCLEPRIDAAERALDDEARGVLSLCNGQTTLAQIAAITGMGDYKITRIAYHLVKGRVARIRVRARIDAELVTELCIAFTAVMRDIYRTIARQGGLDRAREMLGAWVNGCGYDTFFGPRVLHDGTIDPGYVLAALAAARGEDPVATFHQVAHELVSFAMFTAGSTLPRDEDLRLSKNVNDALQLIKLPQSTGDQS
jgi:hypothetical protein